MKLPHEYRGLADAVLAQGWRIEPTNREHFRWLSPDGKYIVITSKTPSDRRALANIRSDLRRAGLKV